MNYQCWGAATKEQLLHCKDNLIKILYFYTLSYFISISKWQCFINFPGYTCGELTDWHALSWADDFYLGVWVHICCFSLWSTYYKGNHNSNLAQEWLVSLGFYRSILHFKTYEWTEREVRNIAGVVSFIFSVVYLLSLFFFQSIAFQE